MLRQFAKFKILVALIISFMVTNALTRNLFLANTPSVNKLFLSNLKYLPQKFIASIVSINKPDYKKFETLPVTALKQISLGVYAGENNKGNIVYIRVTKDVQYEEKTLNYEGKYFKVRFPKESIK